MTVVSPRPQASRRARWRRLRRIVIPLLVVFAVFCAVTARLFIWPATGMPARVNAIVVPAGSGDRLGTALKLAQEGRAQYLAISFGLFIDPGVCGTRVGTARVICFQPSPDTTQGEAQETAVLAKRYGWRSIVLVTTPDQIWRAELRFRRCFGGDVYGVTTPLPLLRWPYEIAYQWAATVKAELVNRSC